jgi:hypothetical protein
MLAQDPLTGGLYEVPELGEYPEVGEAYSGYGLGFPGLANLFGKLIPQVGNILGGGLPGIIGGLFGGGGAPRPPIPLPPIPGIPQLPGLPNLGNIFGQAQRLFGGGGPAPFRPPFPLGWVRPPLPYTGFGPKRLYMRCAVWPGPRGLVPATALTPGAMTPAVPVVPALVPGAGPMGGRRHRRGRRRR